jgi:hypothetical protein
MSTTYDVYCDQTTERVVCAVNREVAERECTRLNREVSEAGYTHYGVPITHSIGETGKPLPPNVKRLEPPPPDVSSDEWYVRDYVTSRAFGRNLSRAEAIADADTRNLADEREPPPNAHPEIVRVLRERVAYQPVHENQVRRRSVRMLGGSADAAEIIEAESEPINWADWEP